MARGIFTSFSVNLGVCIVLVAVACSQVNGAKRGFFSNAACTLFGKKCENPEDKFNYGVLIDAGSSSSKLKVYKVTPASEASELPKVELVFDKKFEPGLSDATDVEIYLRDILSAAKEKVPASKQSSTPLSLKATAGLRFLTAEEATNLVEEVQTVLRKGDINPFPFKPADIGILSGEEEGVYAWVAANYLLGFFSGNKPDSEAIGVLEMGGGSTQITFVPVSPLYDGEFQVYVGGRRFDLYVHSYLQFGINAINLWVAQVLSEWHPQESVLGNPCLLEGDEMDVELEDGRPVKLVGRSDPVYCKEILNYTLAPDTGLRCEPKPCAVGTVYQPDVDDIQFYATQGFTYAPNTLNVVGEDKVLHLRVLERAANVHCQRSLDEAVEAGIKRNLASTTCLMGLYIPTLFTLSYGFDYGTTNIKVTSNVGDASIDWALGAMVIEVSGNRVSRKRQVVL